MNWPPILTCLGPLLTRGEVLSAEPANPNGNARTHAVLNYFHSLTNRAEKRILSRQFADFGNGANLKLIFK